MTAALCPCCHRPLPSVYEGAIVECGLTGQERKLFLAIAGGAGEPVSNNELIDALWADAAWGGPLDTGLHIAVVVSRTNAKIVKAGYRLVNVRRIGYRLTSVVAEAS